MQLFREKTRIIEISIERSREMDTKIEKTTIINPNSRFLPLDDFEADEY
ncbi:MAG TPA: hypothetical protein VK436_16775 [Methanocella sp.]|nr:hypothetical protein [Methanocella sp.]